MRCCPGLFGWSAVFLLLLPAAVFFHSPATVIVPAAEKPAPASAGHDWPMFGGTPQRNMVNLTAKSVPTEWSVKEGKRKNIKWVAELGNLSYGGPIVAGGKVLVGTNNRKPRDPNVKGDKGVVMCFRESDGQFLWQAVHDKLPNPSENDYPEQGIASAPAVDGNRVYYVSNRCELICADTEGSADKKVNILWRLDMIKELGSTPATWQTARQSSSATWSTWSPATAWTHLP